MQGWRISILLNIEIMQVDMLIFLKWISLSSRPSFLKASIPLTCSQRCLIKRVWTECRKYHWHIHCSYEYVYSYKYVYWWQWFSFLHFHCSYELWICLLVAMVFISELLLFLSVINMFIGGNGFHFWTSIVLISYEYGYWWQWFSFLHFYCSYEL